MKAKEKPTEKRCDVCGEDLIKLFPSTGHLMNTCPTHSHDKIKGREKQTVKMTGSNKSGWA